MELTGLHEMRDKGKDGHWFVLTSEDGQAEVQYNCTLL